MEQTRVGKRWQLTKAVFTMRRRMIGKSRKSKSRHMLGLNKYTRPIYSFFVFSSFIYIHVHTWHHWRHQKKTNSLNSGTNSISYWNVKYLERQRQADRRTPEDKSTYRTKQNANEINIEFLAHSRVAVCKENSQLTFLWEKYLEGRERWRANKRLTRAKNGDLPLKTASDIKCSTVCHNYNRLDSIHVLS